MEYITAAHVERLRSSGHGAFVHPVKQRVYVDGWKYYRITKTEIAKLKKKKLN